MSGLPHNLSSSFRGSIIPSGRHLFNCAFLISSCDSARDQNAATGLPDLSVVSQVCLARDARHPEFNSWYRGLKNPNYNSAGPQGLPCCSERDCHETEAEIRNGQWWLDWESRISNMGVKSSGDFQPPLDFAFYDVTWELTEWKEVPAAAIVKTSNLIPPVTRLFVIRLGM